MERAKTDFFTALTAEVHIPTNDFCNGTLGWMYEQGLGVARDLDRAVRLYQKAAKGGRSTLAPVSLIFLRTYGLIAESQSSKGEDWRQRLAERKESFLTSMDWYRQLVREGYVAVEPILKRYEEVESLL